jgi:hypothetical protein
MSKMAKAKTRMDAEIIYKKLRRHGLLLESERDTEGKMRLATLKDVDWLTVVAKLRGAQNVMNGFDAGIFANESGKVLGIYAAFHFFDQEDAHYFTWRYVLSIRPLWWTIVEKEGTLGNLVERRREQWLPALTPELVPVYRYLKKRSPYRAIYPFTPLIWPSPPEAPGDQH